MDLQAGSPQPDISREMQDRAKKMLLDLLLLCFKLTEANSLFIQGASAKFCCCCLSEFMSPCGWFGNEGSFNALKISLVNQYLLPCHRLCFSYLWHRFKAA